jgi:hypothetical protein
LIILGIRIMGTITFCIGDKTGKRFRDVARRRIGDRKGCPGKATTEALELWIRMQPREEIAKDALTLLEPGFGFGKRKYRKREDLYNRRAGSC